MTENNKDKNKRLQKKEQSGDEVEAEDESKKKEELLRKAGTIAKSVKKYIKPKVKIGAKIYNLIQDAESKINELGGNCAFPVNLCVNNIAAHYTAPFKEEDTAINKGDIVKMDIGVHIEGFIVDTAFSVNFNEEDSLENLVQSTKVAVEAAKAMARPEVNTRQIGKKIESVIKGFNFNPIKELGGHQIERWIVHGKKHLPELGSQRGDVMEEGDIFAIEVFASTGEGSVHNTKYSYIYELNPYSGRVPLRRKLSKQILGFVNKNYKTLPFAERWLGKQFKMGVSFGLQELIQQGKLKTHYVLAEQKGIYVAQTEETVLITKEGYEQLT